MSKEEYEMGNVSHEMRKQQQHWEAAAATAHKDWSVMKYTKGKNGSAQFKSKNDFEAYRRKVYNFHKYFLYRARICGRIAEFLEGEIAELEFTDIKQDGIFKKAGKVIYENFINPDVLKNAGGRN